MHIEIVKFTITCSTSGPIHFESPAWSLHKSQMQHQKLFANSSHHLGSKTLCRLRTSPGLCISSVYPHQGVGWLFVVGKPSLSNRWDVYVAGLSSPTAGPQDVAERSMISTTVVCEQLLQDINDDEECYQAHVPAGCCIRLAEISSR